MVFESARLYESLLWGCAFVILAHGSASNSRQGTDGDLGCNARLVGGGGILHNGAVCQRYNGSPPDSGNCYDSWDSKTLSLAGGPHMKFPPEKLFFPYPSLLQWLKEVCQLSIIAGAPCYCRCGGWFWTDGVLVED